MMCLKINNRDRFGTEWVLKAYWDLEITYNQWHFWRSRGKSDKWVNRYYEKKRGKRGA